MEHAFLITGIQIGADNLSSARCETGRHFRNKKVGILRYKINEPETNTTCVRAKMNLRRIIRVICL